MEEMIVGKAALEEAKEISAFHGFKDDSFWRYEYDTYLPAKSVFVAGRADNQIVGSQAFMPYFLNINDTTVLTGRSERTLLNKQYRGSGHFNALMDHAVQYGKEAGMTFVWGSTLAKNAFERVGFSYFTGYLEHSIAIVDYSEAVKVSFRERDKKKLFSQIIALIASPAFRFIGTVACFFSREKASLNIFEKQMNMDDVSELYARIRNGRDLIAIHQDSNFISWAYEQGNRKYKRYYGYSGKELRAYFIIDITDEDEYFIADYAAIDSTSFYAVWAQIIKDLRKSGIGFITVAYNFRNPHLARASQWLKCAGFVPFFRRGGFVLRNISYHDVEFLRDIHNWYITPLWIALYKR